MRYSRCIRRWPSSLAILLALHNHRPAAAADGVFEDLDEAILNDILMQYIDYEPSISICNSSSPAVEKTSYSFEFPGTNAASNWNPKYVPYEELNFQAILSHEDKVGKKSWSVRIGRGGNMYSIFASEMYGETIPGQNNEFVKSPFVDEVQQSVSVSLLLNQNLKLPQYCPGPSEENSTQCKKYYIHQAGAYQNDPPYTDVPFYSPALASHCKGNYCMFASWGTHAQVPTPFTSPILYINKYANCDNGIIEHTQMIHNFADPDDELSTPENVDQTFINAGWGGTRASSLPYVLEPNATDATLEYQNVNEIDYLDLCKLGEPSEGRANVTNLKELGGYTTFVDGGLFVNQTLAPILPACRKAGINCTSSPDDCMVESCTQADIDNGYERIQLIVPTSLFPQCEADDNLWNGLVQLRCRFHSRGYGVTNPHPSALVTPCAPWAEPGLFNRRTGEGINIAYLKHWSYNPNDGKMHFAVYSTNKVEAIAKVDSMFDNRLGGDDLFVDVRPVRKILPQSSISRSTTSLPFPETPPSYDPRGLDTFTYVYGKGEEYGPGKILGKSTRRVGSTEVGTNTRDFTVFTVKWEGSVLKPGMTYVKRGYYFISDLVHVRATALSLVDETHAAKIDQESWSPRTVDIYRKGTKFVALAASSSKGNSTKCDIPTASLACSGSSTPLQGRVPFFYMTCGASLTYFGSDPYNFAPSFGSRFPGHGNINNIVRSYVCDGLEDVSIRPTWKLMGFFDPKDSGCASLATATYDETVCPANENDTATPTLAPTASPTARPISSATATASPTTESPTPKSPTTKSPTTKSPTTKSSTTKSPTTKSPTTDSPTTKGPTTDSPTTKSPTTESPTTASPTTATASPTTKTASPTTESPTIPTDSTIAPTASPTARPTDSPTTSGSTITPTTAQPTSSPKTIEISISDPSLESPYYTFLIGESAISVSSYEFIRGQKYKFEYANDGPRSTHHPFFISDQGRATESTFAIISTDKYYTGILPGGSLEFELPSKFVGTLTYYCVSHEEMTNEFRISPKDDPPAPVPAAKLNKAGGKSSKQRKSRKSKRRNKSTKSPESGKSALMRTRTHRPSG